jgi:hypothetical protein
VPEGVLRRRRHRARSLRGPVGVQPSSCSSLIAPSGRWLLTQTYDADAADRSVSRRAVWRGDLAAFGASSRASGNGTAVRAEKLHCPSLSARVVWGRGWRLGPMPPPPAAVGGPTSFRCGPRRGRRRTGNSVLSRSASAALRSPVTARHFAEPRRPARPMGSSQGAHPGSPSLAGPPTNAPKAFGGVTVPWERHRRRSATVRDRRTLRAGSGSATAGSPLPRAGGGLGGAARHGDAKTTPQDFMAPSPGVRASRGWRRWRASPA